MSEQIQPEEAIDLDAAEDYADIVGNAPTGLDDERVEEPTEDEAYDPVAAEQAERLAKVTAFQEKILRGEAVTDEEADVRVVGAESIAMLAMARKYSTDVARNGL